MSGSGHSCRVLRDIGFAPVPSDRRKRCRLLGYLVCRCALLEGLLALRRPIGAALGHLWRRSPASPPTIRSDSRKSDLTRSSFHPQGQVSITVFDALIVNGNPERPRNERHRCHQDGFRRDVEIRPGRRTISSTSSYRRDIARLERLYVIRDAGAIVARCEGAVRSRRADFSKRMETGHSRHGSRIGAGRHLYTQKAIRFSAPVKPSSCGPGAAVERRARSALAPYPRHLRGNPLQRELQSARVSPGLRPTATSTALRVGARGRTVCSITGRRIPATNRCGSGFADRWCRAPRWQRRPGIGAGDRSSPHRSPSSRTRADHAPQGYAMRSKCGHRRRPSSSRTASPPEV